MSLQSQDGPVRAPNCATGTLASEQEAPVAAVEELQLQQQQQAAPAATATAAPAAPPVALIPIAAFRSNPAGIPNPADAMARSTQAVSRVIGALPRVNTGPPNRRTTLLSLASSLEGIEGALDVDQLRRVAAEQPLLAAAPQITGPADGQHGRWRRIVGIIAETSIGSC